MLAVTGRNNYCIKYLIKSCFCKMQWVMLLFHTSDQSLILRLGESAGLDFIQDFENT